MYCETCGTLLPDDAMFCPACGSKVSAPEAQADAAAGGFDRVDPEPSPVNGAEFSQSGYQSSPNGAPAQQSYQATRYGAPAQQSYQAPGYGAPAQQGCQAPQYGVPAQQGYQAPRYGAPAQQGYQTPGYGAPVQPNYFGAGRGPSPAGISTGGYKAAVILAAIALLGAAAFLIASVVNSISYYSGSSGYVELGSTIWDISIDVLEAACYAVFFVLCLRLKRSPAFLTGIPIAVLFLNILKNIILWIAGVEFMGSTYSFNVTSLIMYGLLAAGVALYIVALALRSDNKTLQLVLRIAAAALLIGYIGIDIYFFVDFMIYLAEWGFWADAFDLTMWIGYMLAELCSVSAMTVILFTAKGRKKLA